MKTFIYCTKAKPYLVKIESCFEPECDFLITDTRSCLDEDEILNGKVVASFDLNEIEEIIRYKSYDSLIPKTKYYTSKISQCELLQKSCLTKIELESYLKEKQGYAWFIENLEIIDSLPLSEFYKDYEVLDIKKGKEIYLNDTPYFQIKKAPQSWQYAYYKGERVLILSVQSKWVCKILNGEKTVEIRKSIPKELKGERK